MLTLLKYTLYTSKPSKAVHSKTRLARALRVAVQFAAFSRRAGNDQTVCRKQSNHTETTRGSSVSLLGFLSTDRLG